MAITINPASLISGAVTKLVQSAVIVGLPTADAPVPLFILCEFPEETIKSSAKLPGALMQAGELKARSVIEASEYEFDATVFDVPMSNNAEIFRVIQVALSAAAQLTNSVASYGAVLPNLSGIATGFVASSMSVLNQIKNNQMPVMILSNYFSLGVVQQTTPYLSSAWYIETFTADHKAGQAGTVLRVKLKEQFTQRNLSLLGIVMSIASETVSANANLAMGNYI